MCNVWIKIQTLLFSLFLRSWKKDKHEKERKSVSLTTRAGAVQNALECLSRYASILSINNIKKESMEHTHTHKHTYAHIQNAHENTLPFCQAEINTDIANTCTVFPPAVNIFLTQTHTHTVTHRHTDTIPCTQTQSLPHRHTLSLKETHIISFSNAHATNTHALALSWTIPTFVSDKAPFFFSQRPVCPEASLSGTFTF